MEVPGNKIILGFFGKFWGNERRQIVHFPKNPKRDISKDIYPVWGLFLGTEMETELCRRRFWGFLEF